MLRGAHKVARRRAVLYLFEYVGASLQNAIAFARVLTVAMDHEHLRLICLENGVLQNADVIAARRNGCEGQVRIGRTTLRYGTLAAHEGSRVRPLGDGDGTLARGRCAAQARQRARHAELIILLGTRPCLGRQWCIATPVHGMQRGKNRTCE